MGLASNLAATKPRILILDIETQRAVVETWSLFKPFIPIARVLTPTRVLCFAAKWYGQKKTEFYAAWRDDDPDAYLAMMTKAFELLSKCDVLVTYNGERFDNQWLEAECGRLGLGRPTPYKSLDLMKVNRRHFKAGQMSLKLDWSARMWLKDSKSGHGGRDLWHDIRHGTKTERLAAQKTMRGYNIHDVELTEQLMTAYLPWAPVNLALVAATDDGLLRCTKCASTKLRAEDKRHHTTAFSYQMFRCEDCGSISRGQRRKSTTELRPM